MHSVFLSTFWGFLGVEAGTTIIQSVKNPKRSIPLALFGGTCVVIAIYLFGNAVAMSILPQDVLAHSPNAYATLLMHTFGKGWSNIMSLVVFVVCVTTVNSWLFVSGQVGSMAAKKNLFPSFFQRKNAKGAPVASIFVTSFSMGGMILLGSGSAMQEQLSKLVDLSVGLFVLTYLASVLSLVRLVRKKEIGASPALWLSILVSSSFCVWVLSSVDWKSFVAMLSISLLGCVLARAFKWPVS